MPRADVASPHLAALAAGPRPAGSAAAATARGYCANRLRARGFSVVESQFKFSAFPGAWGAPAAGVVVSVGAIAIFIGRGFFAVGVAGVVWVCTGLGLLAWAAGRGVASLPLMRRHGVNLEAVRGRQSPTVWLVAHIDSKSQPVSMFLRVAGVALAVPGLAVLAVIRFTGLPHAEAGAAAALIVVWLGSVPLMLSTVEHRNDGALDNASGVAAVLEAVERLPANARVGVLITDAEELALAGVRAWMRSRAPGVAINCDSVDDVGEIVAMYTRRAPASLLSAVERTASATGVPVRVIRMLPGILTDSVPLAAGGWRTVTLSKGSLRTLGRIHTMRDSLETMRGTGIAPMAQMIAHLATAATELG